MKPTLEISLTADGDLSIDLGDNRAVTVPTSPDGLAVIRRILVARACGDKPKLGTTASPIQAIVDAWLATSTPGFDPVETKRRDVAALNLEL